MSKKRSVAVRIYYGLLAGILVYTLVAQCVLTHSQGRSLLNTFSYFTIQSNVLVMITSAILAFWPRVTGAWWRVLRLAALVGITITGIVYTLVLARYVHLSGAGLLYTHILHYLSPVATALGFILVEPRLKLKWRDMIFMAWPVIWLMYTMTRGAVFHPEFTGFGEIPSHYPYEFLDVNQVPLSEVVGAIVIIATMLVAVGVVYVKLDRWLLRAKVNQPTA